METPKEVECEFRSALVFYGGVSLAIYENGVARAFYDAVRGRGVFGPLLEALKTKFVVDVIAGSSAGGINGLMLASCLEAEYDFAQSAKLWREHGGFEDLLRPVEHADTAESLLKGEGYYYGKLRQVFHEIYSNGVARAAEPKEMDVFVTGTHLSGRISEFRDGLDSRISTKDHRVVFHLKHRRGRKRLGLVSHEASGLSPAEESHVQADVLASVARVTSSFPAAFPPFQAKELDTQSQMQNVPKVLPDEKERVLRWLDYLANASETKREDSPQDHLLIDGGVLDNKPFGHVLGAIFHRTPSPSGEAVKRRVFYVEPDPVEFEQAQRKFTPLQVGLAALTSLPSHDSIADDVRSLREHNTRVRLARANRKRAEKRWQDAKKRIGSDREEPLSAERYIDALAQAVASFLLGTIPSHAGDVPELPDVSAVVADLARERSRRSEPVAAHESPPSEARGAIEFLQQLDLDQPLRRLSQVLYAHKPSEAQRAALGRAMKAFKLFRDVWVGAKDGGEAVKLREAFTRVEEARRQLSEADLEEALRAARELVDRRLRRLEEYVCGRWYLGAPMQAGAEAHAWLCKGLDQELLGELVKQARRWLEGGASGHTPLQPVRMVSDAVGRMLTDDARVTWDTFSRWDEEIYPAELAARIYELDEIQLIRIAPGDVPVAGLSGEEKVAGDLLAHFSAFLRKDWRTNDIAWGHCDGLDRIIRALLTIDASQWRQLAQAVSEPSWSEGIKSACGLDDASGLDEASDLDEASRLDAPTQVELRKRLDTLDEATRKLVSAVQTSSDEPKDAARAFTNALVALAQSAAAAEYVDHIIADAKHQNSYWRHHAAPLKRTQDDALAQLAAWKLGSQSIGQGVPPTALLEYGAQSGLLLLGMLGVRGSKAASSGVAAKLYARVRMRLAPVLRVLHFIGVSRRKNKLIAAIFVGILIGGGLLYAAAGFVTENVSRIVIGILAVLTIAWIVDRVLRRQLLALAAVGAVVAVVVWGFYWGGGRQFAAESLRHAADALAGEKAMRAQNSDAAEEPRKEASRPSTPESLGPSNAARHRESNQ